MGTTPTFQSLLALTLSVSLTASCTTVPNKAWFPSHDPYPLGSRLGSKWMVIEVDEAGPIFNANQFSRLKQWLDIDSREAPIVIFINGWHHNAQPDDPNLRSFKTFLGNVEQRAATAIDGIYIGWRGDSYDVINMSEAIDFPSIWDRKRASITVGEHGVREVLTYLKTQHPERQIYVIGHSLGGSALFHAIKDDLPQDVNDHVEYIMLNPAVGSQEFRTLADRVNRRFSTVNAESAMSNTMELLARSNRKLTVLQALGDRPVGVLYRLAFIGATPIGFNHKWITHEAFLCDKPGTCRSNVDDPCSISLANGSFVIRTHPQSGESCYSTNMKPVWVISGRSSVSKNHNDIMNTPQADAIADLIARRVRAKM